MPPARAEVGFTQDGGDPQPLILFFQPRTTSFQKTLTTYIYSNPFTFCYVARQSVPSMTRAQYELFCQNLHHLALDIGLRPACRALGINEVRGRKISSRRKWNLSKYSLALSGHGDPQESP